MLIVLASTSQIKQTALKETLIELGVSDYTFKAVKAFSNVNEQPINQETYDGARQRLVHAREQFQDADITVSIENGLFTDSDAQYIDRAVIMAQGHDDTIHDILTDGVAFPKTYVDEAASREGGFAKWTAGQIMAERGLVKDDSDPHVDLSGISRAVYLKNGLVKLLKPIIV